jgi:sugar phosphate isomerase/epimerase
MKISVSSYSFMQYIRQGKMTVLDTIAKAKEIGLEAIEFIDLPGATLEEQKDYARQLRAEADRLGMTINSYTIGANLYQPTAEEVDAEVERLKGQVEIAAILGAKVMRHDVCWQLGKTGASRSFGLMLPTIAEAARRVTEYAATFGIKTCSENHGYIAQDSYRVEQLFNAVNHDNYGLLVDIGNFICVDEDPALAVSRVAPYAVHVHLKDMLVRPEPVGPICNATRGGNYFAGTVVGEGDIPVKRCLKILKQAGYDGIVSLEYEGSEDCLTGIARGLANVRKILTEI